MKHLDPLKHDCSYDYKNKDKLKKIFYEFHNFDLIKEINSSCFFIINSISKKSILFEHSFGIFTKSFSVVIILRFKL